MRLSGFYIEVLMKFDIEVLWKNFKSIYLLRDEVYTLDTEKHVCVYI